MARNDGANGNVRNAVKVLGIAGSLRRGSYNRALLRAAGEMLPEAMTLETFDLEPIPAYNEDVRAEGYPEPVARLRESILAADALLIITPEYNYSIPGVLKNAIDWASRPPGPPLQGKPVAVAGASRGGFGTVRAQAHLRQVFVFLDMHPLNRPELMVSRAPERFDESLRLVDESIRDRLHQLLVALGDWTRRLR